MQPAGWDQKSSSHRSHAICGDGTRRLLAYTTAATLNLVWGALPRYPYLFGAIQLVEHDPSLAAKVVPALHKFVNVSNTMLHNREGVDAWAATRWEDYVMALQWQVATYIDDRSP